MAKTAIITGITGQDGSYLAELLLKKGYHVHGLVRRASMFNTHRIDHLYRDRHEEGVQLHLHHGDLTDASNLNRLVERVQPDEIYNLAAQSHVKVSFEVPEYTGEVNGLGTLRLLDAIRKTGVQCRFFQASTSELFGKTPAGRQDESTPFHPRSPYAVAKQYAYAIVVNYREAYGLHASNGIMFNHESPRRGETFVTRKITRATARIKAGKQNCLYLGNLEARRDWGYAPDFAQAMWMMLQRDQPDDYVIATGESHSVREFVEQAFAYLQMPLAWEGNTVQEVGIDRNSNRVVVSIDPRYFRLAEVDHLLGDPTKAKEQLGWEPKVRFLELVQIMTEADWSNLQDRSGNE